MSNSRVPGVAEGTFDVAKDMMTKVINFEFLSTLKTDPRAAFVK